jgi:hypothetical protein
MQNSEYFLTFVNVFKVSGKLFNEIIFSKEIDSNIELAFLGFENYLIFGQSSSLTYVKEFLSNDRFEILNISLR